MKFISILSLWLSRLALISGILTIISPLIPDIPLIDREFYMVIFGIATIFFGGLSFALGLMGIAKKHPYYNDAKTGYKYGIYSLLILVVGFLALLLHFLISGGGPI